MNNLLNNELEKPSNGTLVQEKKMKKKKGRTLEQF